MLSGLSIITVGCCLREDFLAGTFMADWISWQYIVIFVQILASSVYVLPLSDSNIYKCNCASTD